MLRKKKKNIDTEDEKRIVKPRRVIKKKVSSVEFTLIEVVVIIVITALVVSVCSGLIVFNNYDKLNVYTEEENGTELSEFISSYNEIINKYVKDVDKTKLLEAAISGMYNYLGDAYSIYMDSATTENLTEQLKGTYDGIGVEISTTSEGEIVIIRTFADSPASNAGLKTGDVITAIDGVSMAGKTSSDASNIIKKGTKSSYAITYKRDNKEFTVNVERKEVLINSVSSKEYDTVGYIKIDNFSATTEELMKKEIDKFSNKIKYLVVDVRDNTGGYLSTAYSTSDLFVEKGKIIYQLKDKKNKITKHEAKSGIYRDFNKIVVLTNGASASASEIFAAALKESANATLLGTVTFGKGTVQETSTLSSGAMVKYTTSYWLTPNGTCINETGIAPDFLVEANAETKEDEQLDAAIKEAKK